MTSVTKVLLYSIGKKTHLVTLCMEPDVLYICADYPHYTLVCLLFSTAIPTSLFN